MVDLQHHDKSHCSYAEMPQCCLVPEGSSAAQDINGTNWRSVKPGLNSWRWRNGIVSASFCYHTCGLNAGLESLPETRMPRATYSKPSRTRSTRAVDVEAKACRAQIGKSSRPGKLSATALYNAMQQRCSRPKAEN
jgi:hypothetical protein